MEKIVLLLATLTSMSLQLDAAPCCPDGFYRVRPVAQVQVNPALNVVGEFFNNFAQPFTGDRTPYLVLGGSGNYSTSSYPQFSLYDLFAAVLDDPSDFGGVTGISKNSESFQNYFWGVYGGYHIPLECNWDIGIELGYKKLVRTNSTVNLVFAVVPPVGDLHTPFRTVHNEAWDLLFAVKYQSLSGFNLFAKFGGAQVRTFLSQGNFIAVGNGNQTGNNAFGFSSFNYVNIYPEFEIGAGYRILDHVEVHLSYAKIIGPYENDLISTSTIFFRPRRCPSIDIFTASLELLLF